MPENLVFAFIRGIIAAGIIWLAIFPSSPLAEYEISLHGYVEQFLDYIGLPVYDENDKMIDSFAIVPMGLSVLLEVYVFFHLAFFSIQALSLIKTVLGLGGSSGSSSGTNNIDNAINYRNSVMGNMNNDEAANLMRETGWLDNMRHGPISNANAARARDYTNSMLGNMSNDKAINWMRNRKE